MPHGLGTQKGGVEQNCATWQAGQISELFQKGPNRKNRAKAKMLIQIVLYNAAFLENATSIEISGSPEIRNSRGFRISEEPEI